MSKNKANFFPEFTPDGKLKKSVETPNGTFSIYDIRQDKNIRRAIQSAYNSGNVKFSFITGWSDSWPRFTKRGDITYIKAARQLTLNNFSRLGCSEISQSICHPYSHSTGNAIVSEGVGLAFLDNVKSSPKEFEFTKNPPPKNLGVKRIVTLDEIAPLPPRTNAEIYGHGVFKTPDIPIGAQCWGGEIFSKPTPYPTTGDDSVYGWYPNLQSCPINGNFFDSRLYLNHSGFSEEEVFNILTKFTCNRWIEFEQKASEK